MITHYGVYAGLKAAHPILLGLYCLLNRSWNTSGFGAAVRSDKDGYFIATNSNKNKFIRSVQ